MKAGDLVEMYGQRGFYGMLLRRTKSDYQGKWWTVYGKEERSLTVMKS